MEMVICVVCSRSHLTEGDNERLGRLSNPYIFSNTDWIHDTGYGFLIRLNAYRHPLLALKERHISKSTRRLIYTLMKKEGIKMIHFDCDAEVIDEFETFDW